MKVKAPMPVRNMNLVVPLAHKATARRTTETAASTQARSGAVTPLIGHHDTMSLRQGDVDSTPRRSTRTTTPGTRTFPTATRTTTTRATRPAAELSADSFDVTSPVIRYHGGKFRLAPWVIGHFPEHRIYIEPFGGAAGVLMQKPRAYAEIYNDLDSCIVGLFKVLRDRDTRERLFESLVLTPYSREEFLAAWEPSTDPVEQARRTIIRAQMGFGSAGATKGATGFRVDSAREYGTAQHIWAKYPNNIAAIGRRLTGVLIENRPAIDCMQQHDADDALHYVDPPYLTETRVMRASSRYYAHELTDEQHVDLLQTLTRLRGAVVLSGYPSDVYVDLLPGWQMRSTKARISAGRGTAIRTECLWLNPVCADALRGRIGGLFA